MSARKPARSGSSSRKKHATTFGSRTDIGCVRKHNEDSLVVAPPLFAVADGMGGHAAGEIASEIAVSTLAELAPDHADSEALGNAVKAANRAVIRAPEEGKGREGMGTTMTAAILEGERLVIAQVGDSRAYLLHQGKLQQLTRDHSLVADLVEAGQITPAEARVHPNRSVITRALGSDPGMVADLYEINVAAGDRLMLCSDGLSGMLVDDEIEDILTRVSDPQRCANMLVNQAIAAGGHDNVTVIVVDVVGFAEARAKRSRRKTKASVVLIVLALIAVVAGSLYGFNYYLQHSYYLANDDGKVAVYHGVPGSLFGLQVSSLDEVTDINVDDLQPGTAQHLNEGIKVDDLDQAMSTLDEYREQAKAKKEQEALQDGSAKENDATNGQSPSAQDNASEPNPQG